MTIHEKAVIRFEAVCDECGKYLGEYADASEARQALRDHHGDSAVTTCDTD